MKKPHKNDWVTCVIQDLDNIYIDLELIETKNMSEENLNKYIKRKSENWHLNNYLKRRILYKI